MLIPLLIGAAVGGGTYLYAKGKKVKNGTAAVAGGATAAGTAAAVSFVSTFWPVILLVGAPAALMFYWGRNKGEQKALGPGRDS